MSRADSTAEPSVAFLGYPVSRARALEDPTLSLADNRMQHGYLRALREQLTDVSVFSSVPAGPDADPAGTDSLDDGVPVRHVGVSTHRVLRGAGKLVGLHRELAAWAAARPGRPLVLLHYNTFLLYSLVGLALRLRHGVRVVPIAITLPYRTPDTRPTLSARVQGLVSARLLRRTDGLVAISPYLAQELNPEVVPCLVRGAVDPEALAGETREPRPSGGPRRIVYAGNLSHRYNLDAAIAMTEHLPPGHELHLYGRGAWEEKVCEAAARSDRVHFHGAVEEGEVASVLREADVILALLSTDDHLARHSFPSKLFESLASGTPVLTTDLPTLDATMRPHLAVVEDLSPEHLARRVVDLCDRSEAEQQAASQAALAFLAEHGTWTAVGRTLHTYLTHPEGWSRG